MRQTKHMRHSKYGRLFMAGSKAKEKFYVVTRLHKDDLREVFRNDPKMLKAVNRLDDSQMSYIASKLADDYVEQLFWSSLRSIAEDVIESES